ncbi:TetR/AcrR family transcriptional regulator [Sulfuricurvum sp.]|uniref:TetR/AcrR family transcriptional regulator n=1 Tax=Sulfuricurvum sp. TaxID=2025608 RepID=UPI003567D695
MPIIKTDKETILKDSIALFKLHGYHNTTMAKIGEACGLIKGSIYHYFKSKEELGLESLRYIHRYFEEHIFSIAYRNDLSDREKIALFVQKTDEYFLNSAGGCLLGNLALEASHDLPLFKEEILAYFDNWEKAVSHIMENRYGAEKAKEIAVESVASVQGAIMMMNLYNDSTLYLKIEQKLIALLD